MKNIQLILLLVIPFSTFSQLNHEETITYSYDNLNRLLQTNYPDGSVYAYAYDNLGNRTQLTYSTTNNPVGLNENLLKSTITVFPNPANDKVSIEVPEPFSSDNFQLSVMDMTGKVVIEESKTTVDRLVFFNVKNLQNGVYLVTLKKEDESWSQLIIKK